MRYENLGKGFKTYVVQHTTGFGEQGGEPIRYLEYVGSFNTFLDAAEFGRDVYPSDQSGWTYDDFSIVINTFTKVGKELLHIFREKCKEIEQKIKDNPDNYETFNNITFEKNSNFEVPIRRDYPLESYRMVILDVSN